MSYPKKLEIFRAWAKAMELGATVDKPSYRGTKSHKLPARKRKARGKSRRRKRLKKKKED